MLRASHAVASRQFPGELENGDRALVLPQEGAAPGLVAAVIDGAGHGPLASAAASILENYVHANRAEEIQAALQRMHQLLHGTRGAVAALAHLDLTLGRLEYGGVGNIEARLLKPDGTGVRLISYSGLLGSTLPRLRVAQQLVAAGDLLVLHSDGISGRWDAARYPGLHAEQPSVVAEILLRDWGRETDDATVLVLRFEEQEAGIGST